MAVTCGTPTPATTRVVQMDPGPTPTLMPSAPAATRAWAPARVATLPPTTSMSEFALILATIDRKSVVEGKRVDLGGRCIIKKKKKKLPGYCDMARSVHILQLRGLIAAGSH